MHNNDLLEKVIADVSHLMADMESQAFQDEGFSELSMRQILYFTTITRLDSPTFSDLARALNVTKPSVTSIVGHLIQKGYVRKVQDAEDRRTYHLILTPHGMDFQRLHETIHRRMADILVSRLSPDDLSELARLLEKALAPN